MTQHLIGLLQVMHTLGRRSARYDLGTLARLSGAPPDQVARGIRKLARWGLIDRRGRLTKAGVWMSHRIRSAGTVES